MRIKDRSRIFTSLAGRFKSDLVYSMINPADGKFGSELTVSGAGVVTSPGVGLGEGDGMDINGGSSVGVGVGGEIGV